MPPLRERPEDILPLALHFIRQHRRSHRLKYVTTEALEALNKYAWPGNVRELENVIFKATLIPSNEEEVSLKDLPDHICVPFID